MSERRRSDLFCGLCGKRLGEVFYDEGQQPPIRQCDDCRRAIALQESAQRSDPALLHAAATIASGLLSPDAKIVAGQREQVLNDIATFAVDLARRLQQKAQEPT